MACAVRVALVSPFDPTQSPEASGPAAARLAHVGGVERSLAELAKGLAARGHRVTLLCSSDRAGPTGPGTPSVTGASLSGEATGRPGPGSIQVTRHRRLGTVLRAPVANLARHLPADVDLVHVPATYPFTTGPVLRAAAAQGIPTVLDFHFEPRPGTLLGRAAAWAYGRVGPRSFARADAVLVRSMAYARSCPSLARVARERLHVVPNPVDSARFHWTPQDGALSSRQTPHLLFVGRLVPYKGVDVLLRALALLPQAPPLVVAGDGPLRYTLQRLARRLGVRAHFLGAVAESHLPQLYAQARLTVLPSVTRQEAFGITLLESMACGTPVLASDLPGVADVAALGGRAAPAGDPVRLAQEIERCLAPGSLPRGADLAQRICAGFSTQAVAQQVELVYLRTLDGGAGTATASHRPTARTSGSRSGA